MRHRRAVEVAARDDVAGVGEHHRVVGRGVGLDRRPSRARSASASRAAPCTCARAAQRVGVLHLAAVLVRLVDAAAAQQRLDVGRRRRAGRRNGRASWMRASNGWIEPRSASIDSAAAMSAARASRSAPASASASTAVDGCVPLISASPSFGAERDRRQPGARERLRARRSRSRRVARRSSALDVVCVASLAFADQHQREVRERREVAARADRAARRHARMHAAVEQRDQRLERLDADAGEALGQHVRAQRHRRAHGADRQRLADAGGVAAQQVELQRVERVGRDLARRRTMPKPVLMP